MSERLNAEDVNAIDGMVRRAIGQHGTTPQPRQNAHALLDSARAPDSVAAGMTQAEAVVAHQKLADRCSYLYGLAARHGATDDELRGSL